MDPITQGAFGAIFAQAQASSKNLAKAAVIGALAGMAADLDILIRSTDDPLLALQFHRHFTHSLLFIPFGALICSLVLHPLLGKRFGLRFTQTLIWCLLGYATHGLLDACTSYGTQLFWPLSNHRYAWDTISIVDPLVTVPLLFCIICAAKSKKRCYVVIGLIWLVFYFSLAHHQHQRALEEGEKLATSRGLKVEKLEAKPSFANILIWKIITTTDEFYWVDAVKIGPSKVLIWPGSRIEKLSIDRDLPWLNKNSHQAEDVERFRWFSDGHLAIDPRDEHRVVDIRYSLLPQEIKPLWGIQLTETDDLDHHVIYYNQRGKSIKALKTLWAMLFQPYD